jgi:Zinc finger, C3HC4 type (RING finger)
MSSLPSSSYTYILSLDRWWGNKSVFVKKGSSFGKLKSLLIEHLLSSGVVSNKDLDARNQVAHVALIHKQSALLSKDQVYRQWDGRSFLFGMDMVRFHTDYIEVVLDSHYNIHMTLIYKKGISEHKEFIAEALHGIIPTCDSTSIEIDQRSKERRGEEEEDEKQTQRVDMSCVVCTDLQRDMYIYPCMHLCVCKACGLRLNGVCPICRGTIKNLQRVYLS